jgi:hypothetical protein
VIDPVHRASLIAGTAGGTVETIVAELCHRLAVADKPGRDLVRDAVEDVTAGRRPRW